MKTCPYCQEPIQEAAVKCPHCQSDLRSRARWFLVPLGIVLFLAGVLFVWAGGHIRPVDPVYTSFGVVLVLAALYTFYRVGRRPRQS